MRIVPFVSSPVLGLLLGILAANPAQAGCSPHKLGTSRILKVDPSPFRIIDGSEADFGLRQGEVILTFDDGPLSSTTPKILKTLRDECVKATFFYVGRMARAYPKLVREVVAEGHTLGHHAHTHKALTKYSSAKASNLVDQGVLTVQKIAYRNETSLASTPFFRYPYLARNQRTDRVLASKGMIAFGANIDSLDWKKVSPDTVHDRIMRQLRQKGKGIILMHDIQKKTAAMLPRLLRTLKREGYRVVHIVPGGAAIPRSEEMLMVMNQQKPSKEETLLDRLYREMDGTNTLARLDADFDFGAKPEQAAADTYQLAQSGLTELDNSGSVAATPPAPEPVRIVESAKPVEPVKTKPRGFVVLAGKDRG